MKKIFLAAFAFIAFSTVSAQTRINPGFRGGYSHSEITDIKGDGRSNFYLGAFVKFKFAKFYALQPELNYSRQGMEAQYFYNLDPSLPASKVDWNLDYLGLTINNKFYVYKGLNLQVGPYLDFVINKKDIEPRNDVDTGLNLGIGYDFPNGLGIEARFRGGFVDIFDDYSDDDDNFDDEEYNHLNAAFQIGVTYTFDLKKK